MKVTSSSIQGELYFFQVTLHSVPRPHTTPLCIHSSAPEKLINVEKSQRVYTLL